MAHVLPAQADRERQKELLRGVGRGSLNDEPEISAVRAHLQQGRLAAAPRARDRDGSVFQMGELAVELTPGLGLDHHNGVPSPQPVIPVGNEQRADVVAELQTDQL